MMPPAPHHERGARTPSFSGASRELKLIPEPPAASSSSWACEVNMQPRPYVAPSARPQQQRYQQQSERMPFRHDGLDRHHSSAASAFPVQGHAMSDWDLDLQSRANSPEMPPRRTYVTNDGGVGGEPCTLAPPHIPNHCVVSSALSDVDSPPSPPSRQERGPTTCAVPTIADTGIANAALVGDVGSVLFSPKDKYSASAVPTRTFPGRPGNTGLPIASTTAKKTVPHGECCSEPGGFSLETSISHDQQQQQLPTAAAEDGIPARRAVASASATPSGTDIQKPRQHHTGSAEMPMDALRRKLPRKFLQDGSDMVRRLNALTAEICMLGFDVADIASYFEPALQAITKSSQALLELRSCELRAASPGALQELREDVQSALHTHDANMPLHFSGWPVRSGTPMPPIVTIPPVGYDIHGVAHCSQVHPMMMQHAASPVHLSDYSTVDLHHPVYQHNLNAEMIARESLLEFRTAALEELEYMAETAGSVVLELADLQSHVQRSLVCLSRVEEACLRRRSALSAEQCAACFRGMADFCGRLISSSRSLPEHSLGRSAASSEVVCHLPWPDAALKDTPMRPSKATASMLESIAGLQSFSDLAKLMLASQRMRAMSVQVLSVAEELRGMWEGVSEGIVATQHAVNGLLHGQSQGQNSGMGNDALALGAASPLRGWSTSSRMLLRSPGSGESCALEQLNLVQTTLSSLSLSITTFLLILDEMKLLPANMDLASALGSRERCMELRRSLFSH